MSLFIKKRSFIFSVVGHFFVFFLFEISLGKNLSFFCYPKINFCGSVIKITEFENENIKKITSIDIKSMIFKRFNLDFLVKDISLKLNKENIYSLKKIPPINTFSLLKKSFYLSEFPTLNIKKEKREIFLYPVLPKHFLLYFKDRQKILVSISFNFLVKGNLPLLNIRRKRSSGNLEIDLLVMRYLSHYLFRLKDLSLNQWYDVNVELTKK